jgi:KipI family sensor histidine kinase inhibitor
VKFPPVVLPLGDSAVTVQLGDRISDELSSQVAVFSSRVRESDIRGITDVVPAYASLAVHYDPAAIGFGDLKQKLVSILSQPAEPGTAASGRLHRIRVRYDGEDLEEVAKRTGLRVDDVIGIHSEREYRVYIIGFVPGFGYLGPLDERLALPRRVSPRTRVPPGSVAIADRQTAVYPSVTPGGWHLIGTTSERMFDPHSARPSLLAVGDRVKFEP